MAKVTINDLKAQCTRLSDKQIRSFVRANGHKAPPTGLPGMNPKLKYEFDSEDPHFQKMHSLLLEHDKNPARPDLVKKK